MFGETENRPGRVFGLRESIMATTTASNIVAVRFHKVGKLYYFDVTAYPELQPADYVIVETARGRQLGQIIGFITPEKANAHRVKPIERPATARDLMMRQWWEAKEAEALVVCREAGADLTAKMGVKFVRARYNYDGSLLILLFTSEEPNIDTVRLRRTLGREFNTRVEVRRIGARDAAKLIGEYGACGAPRCCSTYLTEFSPISIKMAKAQGISLNPSEITGMCGRLRCCLLYEYEQYVEATQDLPKKNKWIGTPHGEGRVIEVNALKQTVIVVVEENRYEVHKDDLVPLEEFRALQAKAAHGCPREAESGLCERGERARSIAAPEKPVEAKDSARSQQPKTRTHSRSEPRADKAGGGKSERRKPSRGRRSRRPPRSGGKPRGRSAN
jgi:cell fate regulator YaaT (PSP1 superfamily)